MLSVFIRISFSVLARSKYVSASLSRTAQVRSLRQHLGLKRMQPEEKHSAAIPDLHRANQAGGRVQGSRNEAASLHADNITVKLTESSVWSVCIIDTAPAG